MDKERIIEVFEGLDSKLSSDAEICLYGSGAFILLDEDDRTSIDIDVAGPYSSVNFKDFQLAAQSIGIEINPEEHIDEEHIEWVSIVRLCLARPTDEQKIPLWSGDKLSVFTVPPEDLVASKLIRYDEIDQGDIHYLVFQMNLSFSQIEDAVGRLPESFRNDPIVQDNLQNLKQDIELWQIVR